MKKSICLATGAILSGYMPHTVCAGVSGPKADRSRPNIVYIMCDDLGYGDIRSFNPERGKIETPHVDALARQGMRFTDAHGGSSVSTPTRYGVLTGRYSWRTTMQRGVIGYYRRPLIAADRLTVAGMLRRQGYTTSCIGKWHLGFTIDSLSAGKMKPNNDPTRQRHMGAPLGAVTEDGPVTRGFDHFFGFHHAEYMRSLFTDDRVTHIVEPVEILPMLAGRACETIRREAQAGKPFFLYLALSSPHSPIVPSPEWQGRSGLGDYADFVMQTDDVVGQVLRAIDESGIADNTLVIFTSDNGCSDVASNAEALNRRGHFSSAEYRGYKTDIWEGGHRIPFVARFPGRIEAGSCCDRTICLVDVMATCAELTGVSLPDDAAEDSFSFLPLLLNQPERYVRDAVVHHSGPGKFAIREGEWKLEFCEGSGGNSFPTDFEAASSGASDMQLYNLREDPEERRNLAAERPDVVRRLQEKMEAFIRNGRSTPGPELRNDGTVRLYKKDTSPRPKKR